MTIITKTILGTAAAAGLLIAGGSAASADSNYTIKSGDTLNKIAAATYGDAQASAGVSAIAQANSISNINSIFVGETLVIPSLSGNTTTTQTQAPAVKQAASTQQTAATQQAASTEETASSSSSVSGSDASAKAWIANKESTNSYSARNGQYIGKYQLSASYLNGDYSAANQEKVADSYVSDRYGSWSNAKSFWLANGWY